MGVSNGLLVSVFHSHLTSGGASCILRGVEKEKGTTERRRRGGAAVAVGSEMQQLMTKR